MTSEATIGLCVTYHNERELLTELVRSVLREPDQPEEIIVYDDFSSFPASDFVPKDAPVKIIRGSKNRGPAFGRNRLLEHAGTQYVHFHDSDDFFLPGWLKRVRAAIGEQLPDAVFTETAGYIDNEQQLSEGIGLRRLKTDNDLLGFCIENAVHPASGTFSRKLLLRIGGYPEDLWQAEDYAFHIRLAIHCSSYEVITEPLVGVRLRSNSRSANKLEVYRDALQGLKLIAAEIPDSHRSQLAEAAVNMSRQLYRVGDLEGARAGFSWSAGLARAQLRRRAWGYALCARVVGPYYAEIMSKLYGKLPRKLRAGIRSTIRVFRL